ncbi:hypothetical protein [Streptomyces sp. NPDC052015]|uniref:hypothetical protein n=1 Tax=Streptomyces sp. NPDC052015 TaxID=3154755 RepID=UPI00341DC691
MREDPHPDQRYRTIQSSGKNRTFILKIPDGYDRNRPYRLIFGFHWWGGTSTDVATGRTVGTGTWATSSTT